MDNQPQLSGNPIWDGGNSQPSASQNFPQQTQSATSGNPYWDTPSDVSNAQAKVGDPMDKGYCETFVEQMAGTPNMGASAAEAFNNWAAQGKAYQDVTKAPPGSLIYFKADDSNGNAGHVAIADGQGNIIGATYNGVQQTSLKDWISQTGQQPLGYVVP